jgi:hypothetical protein
MGLRAVQGLERCLDVNECVRRQHELAVRSPDQELGPSDVAQLREQDAQPRATFGRRLLPLDRGQQLLAVDPPEAVENEIGEEQSSD